jgi:amicoumacin kinase
MTREYTEPDFTKPVIHQIAAHWGFTDPEFVRWFDNVVYLVSSHGSIFYLRLTPATRRTKAQIESELAILHFLKSRDISATQPIACITGQDVLEFEAGGQGLFACVFTECPGDSFSDSFPADLKAFCFAVGKVMGRLHKILKEFEKPPNFTRMLWNEDRWSQFAQVVPQTEIQAWKLYQELKTGWESLNISSDFGLIHGDFTINNLRYSNTQISTQVSLFDFDGSCEHWYGYELACFLHPFAGYPNEQRSLVYSGLLQGYSEEYPVTQVFLEQLPFFGKMKLLRSFLVYAQEWGFVNLTPEQDAFFERRRKQFQEVGFWYPSETDTFQEM